MQSRVLAALLRAPGRVHDLRGPYQHRIRLVKGGGHSYQGTSDAPDSLLVWTRQMNDVRLHDDLFIVHHGVGSEHWSADGFTRLDR